MKKAISILFSLLLVVGLMGCNNASEGTEKKKTPDDVFVEEFGKAINKRWTEQDKLDDSLSKEENYDENEYVERNVEILEAEIATIEKNLANVEDKELKKLGEQYVEGAKLQIEMFKTTDWELEAQYSEESSKLRKPALITLVDEYNMKIDEEHQQMYKDFKEQVNVINKENAANKYAEQLALEITFERTIDEFSNITYTSIVENTSDIEFDSLQYDVQYLDSEGIVVDNDYIYFENFTPGTKQKVELTYAPEEATTLKLTLDYLSLE